MITKHISRYLDTNGDNTGTKSFTGNYGSGSLEVAYIQPRSYEQYQIYRMIISYEDVGTFDAAKYGNDITLSVGLKIRVSNSAGVVYNLTDVSEPVKANAHWGHYCYDVQVLSFGQGNSTLVARWSFDRSGIPIQLDGSEGEKLEVVLNDNFSGLVNQHFCVQGHISTGR